MQRRAWPGLAGRRCCVQAQLQTARTGCPRSRLPAHHVRPVPTFQFTPAAGPRPSSSPSPSPFLGPWGHLQRAAWAALPAVLGPRPLGPPPVPAPPRRQQAAGRFRTAGTCAQDPPAGPPCAPRPFRTCEGRGAARARRRWRPRGRGGMCGPASSGPPGPRSTAPAGAARPRAAPGVREGRRQARGWPQARRGCSAGAAALGAAALGAAALGLQRWGCAAAAWAFGAARPRCCRAPHDAGRASGGLRRLERSGGPPVPTRSPPPRGSCPAWWSCAPGIRYTPSRMQVGPVGLRARLLPGRAVLPAGLPLRHQPQPGPGTRHIAGLPATACGVAYFGARSASLL